MDISLMTKLFINTTNVLIFLLKVENAEPPYTFRFESVNPAYLEKTGFHASIIGRTIEDTLPIDIIAFVRSQFTKAVEQKDTLKYEEPFLHAGADLLVETTLYPTIDESGRPDYLLGVSRDITERKQSERLIRESEERYRTLVQLSPDAIIIHDQGKIVFCNEAAGRLAQLDHPDELLGTNLYDYIPSNMHRHFELRLLRIYSGSHVLPPFETKMIRRGGEQICVEGTSAFVEHNGKKLLQVVLRDITMRNQEKERLQKLSQLDGLTNIANRRHFDLVLNREVNRARRNKLPLSLILFDIDSFKRYNDHYGHLVGDDCLKRVAEKARALLKRPSDLLARFGGEEFAVLLPETDLYGAEIVAEQLREQIEALEIPHLQSEVSAFVTISLGVSCMTRPSTSDIVPLIERADRALYSAKRQGKNRLIIGVSPY
jgi:diguanylate cyclase (GGDEF)-like protein/PAS domain S-box-containing protein